jgi:hypothetical protein
MSEGEGDRRFFDARGCLTREGLAALAAAPAGRGPQPLAIHVASCPRCQQQLLVSSPGEGPARTSAGKATRGGRRWLNLGLMVAALLAALVALLVTLSHLAGR